MSNLDSEVIKINNAGTINIWQEFKTWFLKNWMYIGIGVLFAGLYFSGIIKNMVLR